MGLTESGTREDHSCTGLSSNPTPPHHNLSPPSFKTYGILPALWRTTIVKSGGARNNESCLKRDKLWIGITKKHVMLGEMQTV